MTLCFSPKNLFMYTADSMGTYPQISDSPTSKRHVSECQISLFWHVMTAAQTTRQPSSTENWLALLYTEYYTNKPLGLLTLRRMKTSNHVSVIANMCKPCQRINSNFSKTDCSAQRYFNVNMFCMSLGSDDEEDISIVLWELCRFCVPHEYIISGNYASSKTWPQSLCIVLL